MLHASDYVNHTTWLKCPHARVNPSPCHPWWKLSVLSVVVSSFWPSPCVSPSPCSPSHFYLYSELFPCGHRQGKCSLRFRQSRGFALWLDTLLPYFSDMDLDGRVRWMWPFQHPLYFEVTMLAGTFRNNSFFVFELRLSGLPFLEHPCHVSSKKKEEPDVHRPLSRKGLRRDEAQDWSLQTQVEKANGKNKTQCIGVMWVLFRVKDCSSFKRDQTRSYTTEVVAVKWTSGSEDCLVRLSKSTITSAWKQSKSWFISSRRIWLNKRC